MSINVNNMNKADIVKLALQKQTGKTSTAKQPEYMTKNGSIFNAPNLKQTTKSEKSSTSENISKLNNQNNQTESTKSYENPDKLKTAAQTKAAIAELKENIPAPVLKLSPKYSKLLDQLEEKHKNQVKQEYQDSQANLKSIARGQGAIKKDGTSSTNSEKETIDGKNVSASEGRAMAKDAEKTNAKLEQQTSQTKKDARIVNNYSKSSKKTGSDIKKDEAKLNKEIASESAKIKQNQTAISNESQLMEQTSAEIEALQSELQSLTADRTGIGENSAYSLKLAGDQSNQTNGKSGAANSDNGRIAELQNQIGIKSDSMAVSGQKLQKLQTSTNKSITVMHNKVTIKSQYYKQAQKTMQAQQKEESGIMKVAQKIDDISQTVTTAGSVLQKVGTGMMAAGAAMSWLGGAGAALISAGKVVKQVGTVTEMVGQYGQTAANITKAACNIAEGNFAGALQSVGTAIQTGAAAMKSTQGLKDNMKSIAQEAENAQTKLDAGINAKEMAKSLKESGGLEETGLTQKQAQKQIKSNLLEKANNGEISFKDGKIVTNATPKMGADGKFEINSNTVALSNGPRLDSSTPTGFANGVQTSTMTNLKNMKDGTGNTSFGQKLGNAVKKGVNTAGNAIKKAASNPDTLSKIGKQMCSMGAKMAGGTQQTQLAGRTTKKSTGYPQYNINYGRLEAGNKMMRRYGAKV